MTVRATGYRVWAIPEGYIPATSHGPAPELTSHEAVCVLNASDKDAHVEIVLYFENAEPAGPYRVIVGAQRTRHLRFNNLTDPQPIPKGTNYSSVIRSDVPIVTPKARTLLVLGYPDVYQAADHVMQIRAHKPIGLEGIDEKLIDYMRRKGVHPGDIKLLPEGQGWLLVEFGGATREESDRRAKDLMADLKKLSDAPTMKLFDDAWEEHEMWEVRESGLAATAHVPNMREAYPGWEDAAVPPEEVGKYLREFRSLLQEFNYDCSLYGHFGQGCIHCRITFDLKTNEGIQTYMRFINRAADLVVKHGGALSGEHGDGQARAALLGKMYGPELVHAFRQFKTIWDPAGKMNPGKVVDPYLPDANLKWSPQNYHPATVETHFRYPSDHGSFAQAVNRCVGVGKCRREDAGTMCPSYMTTREETYSTRGARSRRQARRHCPWRSSVGGARAPDPRSDRERIARVSKPRSR